MANGKRARVWLVTGIVLLSAAGVAMIVTLPAAMSEPDQSHHYTQPGWTTAGALTFLLASIVGAVCLIIAARADLTTPKP